MGATQSYCSSYNDLLTTVYASDPAISRQLVDKMYEKRKAAALELEKCVTYLTSALHNACEL